MQTFEPSTVYTAKHIPSGEEWCLLGIDLKGDRVCAAGYPPTMAKLSDCTDFEKIGPLTPELIKYRESSFGTNWI